MGNNYGNNNNNNNNDGFPMGDGFPRDPSSNNNNNNFNNNNNNNYSGQNFNVFASNNNNFNYPNFSNNNNNNNNNFNNRNNISCSYNPNMPFKNDFNMNNNNFGGNRNFNNNYGNNNSDPMMLTDIWKDKLQTLNSYINEGKFSFHTAKLKDGIHGILEALPIIDRVMNDCMSSGDNNGRHNLSNVKADMEQTCWRFECMTKGKKVESFRSAAAPPGAPPGIPAYPWLSSSPAMKR